MKRKRANKRRTAKGLSPLEAVTQKELLRSIQADLEVKVRAAGLAYPELRQKRRKK